MLYSDKSKVRFYFFRLRRIKRLERQHFISRCKVERDVLDSYTVWANFQTFKTKVGKKRTKVEFVHNLIQALMTLQTYLKDLNIIDSLSIKKLELP